MDWMNNAWSDFTGFFSDFGTAADAAAGDLAAGNFNPGHQTGGTAAPGGSGNDFFSKFNSSIDKLGGLFNGIGGTAESLLNVTGKLLEVSVSLLEGTAKIIPYLPIIAIGYFTLRAGELIRNKPETIVKIDK